MGTWFRLVKSISGGDDFLGLYYILYSKRNKIAKLKRYSAQTLLFADSIMKEPVLKVGNFVNFNFSGRRGVVLSCGLGWLMQIGSLLARVPWDPGGDLC